MVTRLRIMMGSAHAHTSGAVTSAVTSLGRQHEESAASLAGTVRRSQMSQMACVITNRRTDGVYIISVAMPTVMSSWMHRMPYTFRMKPLRSCERERRAPSF